MEREKLRKWFLESRRIFPWRGAPTPYQVWISEVMLQQTQAPVVVPYFERWMQIFPSIEALANAHLDTVLKVWEGLGYYSRARSLHAAARFMLEHYGGELPSEEKDLLKIKGIGPYTVGALRSFAFKEKAAAVDGNVLRVWARYEALSGSIDEAKTQKLVRQKVLDWLPDEAPWEVMEALIELGATVCMREPKCRGCPLKNSCAAYAQGLQKLLPIRKKRAAITRLYRVVAVVMHGQEVLISRERDGKLMSHLCQFPFFEIEEKESKEESLERHVQLPLELVLLKEMQGQEHSFTQFKAFLYPFLFRALEKKEVKGMEWVHKEELEKLPFAGGHRQILRGLREKGH